MFAVRASLSILNIEGYGVVYQQDRSVPRLIPTQSYKHLQTKIISNRFSEKFG